MSHFSLMVRVSGLNRLNHHDNIEKTIAEMMAPYERDSGPFLTEFVEDEDGDLCPNGKRGYFRNPNCKWDWWTIGGRWDKFFPILPTGKSNYSMITMIDRGVVNGLHAERFVHFCRDYFDFLKTGRDDDPFGGIRHTLLNIGLVKVEKHSVEPTSTTVCFPWKTKVRDEHDERAGWTDVCSILTEHELVQYRDYFNPLHTYAILDEENGWNDQGKMFSFGISDATPEDRMKWSREFNKRVFDQAKPHDMLVIVDCHI